MNVSPCGVLASIPSGKIDQGFRRYFPRNLLEEATKRGGFHSFPSEQRLADVEPRLAAMEQTVRGLRQEAERVKLE